MKKRYHDIDIWKKKWFRQLTPEEKCAWFYIKDACDNVGVWDVDLEMADVFIGVQLDWQAFIEKVNKLETKIEMISEDQWWLPTFCDFQYPGFFNENVRAHQSYRRDLERHNLWDRIGKGSGKGKGKGKPRVSSANNEYAEKAAEVIAFLNEKTGQNFDPRAKGHRDWLAPRFRDGHTVDECKKIVIIKTHQWLEDEKMRNHLTPTTLFGKQKFDTYLGEYETEKARRRQEEQHTGVKEQERYEKKLGVVG